MSTRSPAFLDGYYGTPVNIFTSPKKYPFASNGDLTTAFYVRTYLVAPGLWTPTALGTSDPADSNYKLIAETEPDAPKDASVAMFTRTYARVPSTQTRERSTMISRPSPNLAAYPGPFGDYRIFQPDTTLQKFDAYLKNDVTSDSGAPASFYPTGGTYTLSLAGSTTAAIAYNANAAAVQTALNAITSVSNRGNCTVAGTYNSTGGFTVTFNAYAQITIATGSLTNFGTKSETLTNSGYSQIVSATRVQDGTVNAASLTVGGGTPSGLWVYNPTVTSRDFIIGTGTSYQFTGGTFTLTVQGVTTAAIAYNATFAAVKAALDALGIGTFTVEALPGTGDTAPLTDGDKLIRARVIWDSPGTTGGTFTLTAFGSTTAAIAYNASAATVQTALNALAVVSNRGGCTVSGDLASGLSIAFSNGLFVGGAGSLTPSGSGITAAYGDGSIGRVQAITFPATALRTLYAEDHGISADDTIFIRAATDYYGEITRFTLLDENTVQLSVLAADAYAAAATITEVGRRTKQSYTPGSAPAPVNDVTRFSLSAITPDTYQGDDATFLEQIFAGDTAINYRVGDSARWPDEDSPIRSLTTTQVSAENL